MLLTNMNITSMIVIQLLLFNTICTLLINNIDPLFNAICTISTYCYSSIVIRSILINIHRLAPLREARGLRGGQVRTLQGPAGAHRLPPGASVVEQRNGGTGCSGGVPCQGVTPKMVGL